MPDGLKIWIQLADGSTSETSASYGTILSQPFTKNGKLISAGPHRISFTAYFNEGWNQPSEIIAPTGMGGSKLHGKLFRKTDPDVIDSEQMLEYTTTVSFPAISRELQAISLAKSSTWCLRAEDLRGHCL
jgi:hypothetical protein